MYDHQSLEEIKKLFQQWEETTLQKSLDRLPERKKQFITTS